MFGGLVESVDHCGVLEGVHFEDDTSAFALVGKGYFTVDEAVQFRYEVEAGDEESGEFRIFLALQGAEEVVKVVHYFLAAGEKSTVGVQGGGLFVEVARADVGVAGDFLSIQSAATDEGHFGVYF